MIFNIASKLDEVEFLKEPWTREQNCNFQGFRKTWESTMCKQSEVQ